MTAHPDERPASGATSVGDHLLDAVLPAVSGRPPEHVLTAFSTNPAELEPLPGGRGRTWRAGNAVFRPVEDPAEASWLASVFEQRPVPGVRIARPVRSTDGRWVVSGWTAHRFVSGAPAPRFEEARRAGQALHEAVADVPEPRFLKQRTDLHSWADRLAWGEVLDTEGRLGHGHGATTYRELAALRRPVDAPNQLVHGDLHGHVLFAGNAMPAVIDVAPYWRPAGWAIGVLGKLGLINQYRAHPERYPDSQGLGTWTGYTLAASGLSLGLCAVAWIGTGISEDAVGIWAGATGAATAALALLGEARYRRKPRSATGARPDR